ncbi:MAG: fumarylacetoacetate hydrolase family protein, partial [Roseiarcus sp.]
MKFRRIRSPDGSNIERQALRDGAWRTIENARSAFTPEWELEAADRLGLSPSLPLLPIQPLSFRDFMLFERHAVDAARGYAKRFMPGRYKLAHALERLSGATFPPFKPAPLWYRQPIYYMSNHLAFVPSGAPVRGPSYSGALDYELELGFILAQPLFNASAEEATRAIGAFVVLNDFSARDLQFAEMRSGFGPQKSKHFL